ncbi:MAG: hypothetical protein WBM02_10340 [bacterium]
MADDRKGCLSFWDCFIYFGYWCALEGLKTISYFKSHPWLCFIASIPTGFILTFPIFFIVIKLPFILLPGLAIVGMYFLFTFCHYNWIIAAGIGYLLIGLTLAYFAGKETDESDKRIELWNAFWIILFGIITIFTGVFKS